MSEVLYVIDGHAQIFRAYFAIRNGMNSPVTGEPTNAVFGFVGMLTKLLREYRPDYVVVAADAPGRNFRHELHPEYKATREKAPDDFHAQVPRVMEMLEAFDIPVIAENGVEADDLIATICRQALADPDHPDLQVRIVSKDKDLEQLIGERVALCDVHTDTLIDAEALWENKGIRPDQVIDALALMGDTSDNIPGVEGIGQKTAAKLVNEYGSLEALLANLDAIKGKRRENIEKAREHLPLSKRLVTLDDQADIVFDLDAARVRPLNQPRIYALFDQLGFQRYRDDVRELAGPRDGEARAAGVAPGAAQAAMTAEKDRHEGEPDTAEGADYRAITTREQLDELVATLKQRKRISVDTETTGVHRHCLLCGIALSWAPRSGVYVPTRSPQPETHLDEATVIDALRPILEDEAIEKVGHNLKFDAGVFLNVGVHLRGICCDSMLASALMDQRDSSQKLDHLAMQRLHYRMIPIDELLGAEADGDGDLHGGGGLFDDEREDVGMQAVPVEQVTPYAAEDADIALRLCEVLEPELAELGMERLLHDVEAPLAAVLAEMEHRGIACDPEELLRQGDVLKERVVELEAEIQQAAGCEFNVASPTQLAEVLFDKLGFKPGRRTKTGYSTDAAVLETLAESEDPAEPTTTVPRLVLEHRQLTKLIGTYLDTLRQAIDPRTARIHTTFHQLVTATGRLASNGPNLQNIPVRTALGRQIRGAFFAPEGWRLICADYSQIELRLLAHLSEDENLIDAFERGQDIHTAVAAQVFGVPPEVVSREMRDQAKTVNFGIIYGVTPFGLARRIEGLDVEGARNLIADYKRRFPGIERFLQACVAQAEQHGYVVTMLGRRRSIPEIESTNRNRRALGERLAINTVVQGSAADLIKIAMVNVQRRIERDGLPLKMLLQIHDELVLEAPEAEAEGLGEVICEEMAAAMDLRVPLLAECGIGRNWLEAK